MAKYVLSKSNIGSIPVQEVSRQEKRKIKGRRVTRTLRYLVSMEDQGEERVEAIKGHHTQKTNNVTLVLRLGIELEMLVDEVE